MWYAKHRYLYLIGKTSKINSDINKIMVYQHQTLNIVRQPAALDFMIVLYYLVITCNIIKSLFNYFNAYILLL